MTDATELDLDAVRARLDDHAVLVAADCRKSLPTKGAMQEALGRSRTDVERLLAALDEAQAEARGWADEARGLHAEVGELTSALRAAESSLAAVRALHREVARGPNAAELDGYCRQDGQHWPCRTSIAIDGGVEDGVFSDPDIHSRLTRAALAPTPPDEDRAAMGIDPEPPGVTLRPFTAAEASALDSRTCACPVGLNPAHDCDLVQGVLAAFALAPPDENPATTERTADE